MNLKKSLIIGASVLTLAPVASATFVSSHAYASEVNDIQQVEENIEITYDKQGNPLITVYEEDVESSGDIVLYSTVTEGGKVVAKWDSWNKLFTLSNTFVANAINAGVNGGILGIASKIPLGGSVLKGLLTAAGWTSAAGKVGSTIANQWDTNNNGKVEFYMRRGRGYRGEIVATQYQTR